MKKMKSILALLLAVTLALSLTACGSPAPGTDMSDPAPSGALSDREEGSVIFSIDWPAYIDPGVGNKAPSRSLTVLSLRFWPKAGRPTMRPRSTHSI